MTDIALPRNHRQTLISRQEVLKIVERQLYPEFAPSGAIALLMLVSPSFTDTRKASIALKPRARDYAERIQPGTTPTRHDPSPVGITPPSA